MKDIHEIASRLIELLHAGRNSDAYSELYADDAECIEADPDRSRAGLAGLVSDMREFENAHEFSYECIDGPVIAGSSFALGLRFTARPSAGGESFTVDELAVYTVDNGRIVREQFFYVA